MYIYKQIKSVNVFFYKKNITGDLCLAHSIEEYARKNIDFYISIGRPKSFEFFINDCIVNTRFIDLPENPDDIIEFKLLLEDDDKKLQDIFNKYRLLM